MAGPGNRRVLVVKSGGEAAVPEWQEAFRKHAPGLDVRWWGDPTVDPASVDYALVWEPDPGRLATFPNLAVIFSSAAGVDHITRDPHLPRHVPIVRMASDETAQTIAEYVCMTSLMLLRDFPRMTAAQAARTWDNFEPSYTAREKCVGVMGLGNMGRRTTSMLRGIGFRLRGWSRTAKSIEGVDCYAGNGDLERFLLGVDILVGLLPDTPDTSGLMNATRLAFLPRGAGLINAGRGSFVVLPDLVAALDSGHLKTAILDVFDPEPLPSDDPLWRHPRIIITCHVAGYASRPARAACVAREIAAFERGETMSTVYLPERGY